MKSTKNCSDGQFLFFNRNFIAIIWKMVLSASYLVLFKRLLACFRRLTTSWPYVPIVLPHLVKSPYKTILIRASNLCSSMVALMKLAMGYWLSLWKMVYYGCAWCDSHTLILIGRPRKVWKTEASLYKTPSLRRSPFFYPRLPSIPSFRFYLIS